MRKVVLAIMAVLCVLGVKAQQPSSEEGKIPKPKAVIMIGDRVITGDKDVTVEEFLSLPCRVAVVSPDTTSYHVVSFSTFINGLEHRYQGNTIPDEVKEKAKSLKKGAFIIFRNIRVQRSDGRLIQLSPVPVQFAKRKPKK